jgi:NAD(P) transhydrogenase subunit alpha
MPTIGSVKEDRSKEKRISIAPEAVKKFTKLGLSVNIQKNYAEHLNITDEEYQKSGANIKDSQETVFKESDIILKVNSLTTDELDLIKTQSIIIGQFDLDNNRDIINKSIKKNIKIFSLNLLPRITRAQSMDVLSSQANLAGYKAVIESFSVFEKAIPMMMTAAGTVPAAKVLVIGAGVAGLQAIATAKRMGAIVFATDVRAASKEQVESLGGKFLVVEALENLETKGGYAKEASEDFKKKQESVISEALKKIDIVICTALIPGKKAPLIITEDMINNMKAGSLIYDLAAAQGGNAAFTEVDKIINKNGVKIIGERNILNKLPVSSSNLYAKNLLNFTLNLYDNENKKININLEDEIINKTLVK